MNKSRLAAQLAGKKKRRAARKAAAKARAVRCARYARQAAAAKAGLTLAPLPGDAGGFLGDEADEPNDEEDLTAQQDENEASSYLSKGLGSTDAARWRVTLIARQAIEKYWQADEDPVGSQSGNYHRPIAPIAPLPIAP